jgi:hypothetical protein
MNRLKKYRGLIKKTWFATTGITLLVLLFGVPSFPRFQKTGDNFYKVSINGTEIGNSSDPEEVERLVAEARREITETEGTMVYIPVEITSEGQELLFGNTDSRHNLYKAIYDVLKSNISTTLQHAYTVKINEYTVNLGSSSDVRALLQAALDRYDTEHAYRADIVIDPDRQLNVLTTSVSKNSCSTQRGKVPGRNAFLTSCLKRLSRIRERWIFPRWNTARFPSISVIRSRSWMPI